MDRPELMTEQVTPYRRQPVPDPRRVVYVVLVVAGLVALLSVAGLVALLLYQPDDAGRWSVPQAAALADAAPGSSEPPRAAPSKKIPSGRNVYLEILEDGRRRVLVSARVCLREGELEQFLCRKQTKEHEAILAADVDARDIHKALLAAGAVAGSPVKYGPPYEPATGSKIRVLVQYEKDRQVVTEPAQRWIRNTRTKKDLEYDWVFAGSRFIPDPMDRNRPDFYAANDGDLICVSNFDTAMLDLPVQSSKDNQDLTFEAHTARIPARDTSVVVILEPIIEKKP